MCAEVYLTIFVDVSYTTNKTRPSIAPSILYATQKQHPRQKMTYPVHTFGLPTTSCANFIKVPIVGFESQCWSIPSSSIADTNSPPRTRNSIPRRKRLPAYAFVLAVLIKKSGFSRQSNALAMSSTCERGRTLVLGLQTYYTIR